MKFTPVGAVFSVVLAALLATTGFVLVLAAEAVGWRIAGALLAALAVFVVVAAIRSSSRGAAHLAMVLVPVLLLTVGLPVAAAVRTTATQWPARPAGAGGAIGRLPADPDAQLVEALAEADRLAPGGAEHLLAIDLEDDSSRVRVYDPRNGDELSSFRSGDRWHPAAPRRATQRRVFGRSELTQLNLTAATGKVAAVAGELGLTRRGAHPSDGIELHRREDDLLVAEFTVADRPIEVDARGAVADTAGVADPGAVLETSARILRGLRLDPAAPIVRNADFRTITEGSWPLSASAIQNSGGISLDLAAGPYGSVRVVPGCFPLATPRTGREAEGFPLTAVTSATLLAVRDDLLARNDLPAFDGDLVAFALGGAPGDRAQGPVIRMAVGPSTGRAAGVYTFDGEFLRPGSW